MKYVNQPVRKTDAMSLVTGKPVYTDDLAPRDCLIVKILRSPHANAWVEDIKTGTAEKVAGIACILTYKDVPQKRFTLAGQTAPEMSPDDRLILDRHVRFVGDAVAIVAGEPAEDDGDFPHSLLYGSFRQTDRSVLNTDPIPCAKDRWKGTGHSCLQSTCDQAKDRWRLWCKADLCQ